MSCIERNRLIDGGRQEEFESHRAVCSECEALGREIASGSELALSLAPPSFSAVMRERLYAIPGQTVSCETADEMLAIRLEQALPARESARLAFHLSRCEACLETSRTMGVLTELVPPAPMPWLAGRLAASKPPRTRTRFSWIWSPRGAVGLAYGLAVILMLAGFNPADLARQGDVAEQSARVAVSSARTSLSERVGEFQQSAARRFAILRGKAGGYGRAVIANTFHRLMRTDETPETRPAPGREEGNEKKEETTQLETWRA